MKITRWSSARLLDAIRKHESEAAYQLRERVVLDGPSVHHSCLRDAMAHAVAAGRLERILCGLAIARAEGR